jgi:hypothetical protein
MSIRFTRHLRWIGLITLCLAHQLSAQTPGNLGSVRTEVSIIAQGTPSTLAGLQTQAGGQLVTVPLKIGQRGPTFIYSGPSMMPIGREVTSSEGKKQFVPLVQVSLPPGSNEAVVFLGEAGGQFRAMAIDFSPAKLPAGTVVVMNFSGQRIAAKIGPNEGLVEPGNPTVFGPYAASDAAVVFKFLRDDKGSWMNLPSRSFVLRPNMRLLLLLLPGTADDPVKYQFINDALPPKAAPGVGAR